MSIVGDRDRKTRYATACGAAIVADTACLMLECVSFGNDEAPLERAIESVCGAPPPPPGHALDVGRLRVFRASPRRLLIEGEADADEFARQPGLQVCDVGDGFASLACSGASLRAWLGRFMSLDLRDRSFRTGQVTWAEFLDLRVLLYRRGKISYGIYLPASGLRNVLETCLNTGAISAPAENSRSSHSE